MHRLFPLENRFDEGMGLPCCIAAPRSDLDTNRGSCRPTLRAVEALACALRLGPHKCGPCAQVVAGASELRQIDALEGAETHVAHEEDIVNG